MFERTLTIELDASRTVRLIVSAVVYYYVTLLGGAVATMAGVPIVAFALGLAFALIYLWGQWTTPLLFIAALLVHLTQASFQFSGVNAADVVEALANVGGAAVGAALVRRFNDTDSIFAKARSTVVFILLGAGVTSVVAAAGALIKLKLNGMLIAANPWLIGWALFCSAMLGVLVTAPMVMVWYEKGFSALRSRRALEGGVALALALVVSWVVFGQEHAGSVNRHPLAFALMPFMIWAGMRLDSWSMTTVIFTCTAFWITGTVNGRGPFAGSDLIASLQPLQSFIAVMAGTALGLHAVVREWKLAETSLELARAAQKEANVELERRVEERTATLNIANRQLELEVRNRRKIEKALKINDARYRSLRDASSDAVLTIEEEAIVECNPAASEVLGVETDELIDKPLYVFAPSSQPGGDRSRKALTDRLSELGEGNGVEFDWTVKRADGRQFSTRVRALRLPLPERSAYQVIVPAPASSRDNATPFPTAPIYIATRPYETPRPKEGDAIGGGTA